MKTYRTIENHPKTTLDGIAIFLLLLGSSCANKDEKQNSEVIQIEEQGSFTVGGTVIENQGTFDPYNQTPEGQTFHGDHAYVFYQVPADARELSAGDVARVGSVLKTWETTPDGREGYQNIFAKALSRVCHRSTSKGRCRPQYGTGDN